MGFKVRVYNVGRRFNIVIRERLNINMKQMMDFDVSSKFLLKLLSQVQSQSHVAELVKVRY